MVICGRRRGRGGGRVAQPDDSDMLCELLPLDGLLPGAAAGRGAPKPVRQQYRNRAKSDGMRGVDPAGSEQQLYRVAGPGRPVRWAAAPPRAAGAQLGE